MTDDEDDYGGGYDPADDTDATIRRLETEVARLTAGLDQLAADLREQKAEAAITRARVDEVEKAIRRIEARRKRDRYMVPVWMLFWAAVWAVVLNWLFF